MPTLLASPTAATLVPKVGGAVLVAKVGGASLLAQPIGAATLSYSAPTAPPSVAVVGSALVGTATVG